MRARPTLTMLTTASAALLLVAGCSGDDGGDTSNTATGGPVTVTASPQTSQAAGAIKELDKVQCTFKDGTWSFSATLTNAGKDKASYTVTVAVAKTQGGTVVGSTQLSETLDAGESTDLSAPDFFKGTDKGVSCVPSATKKPA